MSPTESRCPSYPFLFTVPPPPAVAPSFSAPSSLSLDVPSMTCEVPVPSKVFTPPSQPYNYSQPQHDAIIPQPGTKHSAGAAFSPTTANFSGLPSKRPPSMSLEIPPPRSGPPSTDSHSPLDSLQSFANMSLGSSPQCGNTGWMANSTRLDSGPQTLVAPYRIDEHRSTAVPQVLQISKLAHHIASFREGIRKVGK